MNTSINITDLPLEVLGLIFEELPSLEDRLSLAQVHPHMGCAFSCNFGHRFKNLNVTEKELLSVLLPLYGSRVEHINGDFMSDGTMLKLVELHCPDLQSINLCICENNFNSIKSFLTTVKRSLRSINLSVAWQSTNYLGIFELLKLQPSLRTLRLDVFPFNELLEVRKLVNLEELRIDCCMDQHLNIHELTYHLRNLRTLHVNCQGSTASTEFDGVPCPALRELHLSDSRDWSFVRTPSRPAILKWILSHAETLQKLTLNTDITDYEPEEVIYKILSECKNLRSLSKEMDRVDTDFANRVVKIVSENGVTSEELPLDLNFHNRRTHEGIQKVMDNTSSKQFITIPHFTSSNQFITIPNYPPRIVCKRPFKMKGMAPLYSPNLDNL